MYLFGEQTKICLQLTVQFVVSVRGCWWRHRPSGWRIRLELCCVMQVPFTARPVNDSISISSRSWLFLCSGWLFSNLLRKTLNISLMAIQSIQPSSNHHLSRTWSIWQKWQQSGQCGLFFCQRLSPVSLGENPKISLSWICSGFFS